MSTIGFTLTGAFSVAAVQFISNRSLSVSEGVTILGGAVLHAIGNRNFDLKKKAGALFLSGVLALGAAWKNPSAAKSLLLAPVTLVVCQAVSNYFKVEDKTINQLRIGYGLLRDNTDDVEKRLVKLLGIFQTQEGESSEQSITFHQDAPQIIKELKAQLKEKETK